MNDFSELESELKQLRPAAASQELMTRMEQALHATSAMTPSAGVLPKLRREFRINWFAFASGLAATALFLILARSNVDRTSSMKPTSIASAAPTQKAAPLPLAFLPDGVTRVVYNTSNEGLYYPRDGAEPSRRVRSHSRETMQWKDANSGASLRVSYPTEDVELIPVSMSVQ